MPTCSEIEAMNLYYETGILPPEEEPFHFEDDAASSGATKAKQCEPPKSPHQKKKGALSKMRRLKKKVVKDLSRYTTAMNRSIEKYDQQMEACIKELED